MATSQPVFEARKIDAAIISRITQKAQNAAKLQDVATVIQNLRFHHCDPLSDEEKAVRIYPPKRSKWESRLTVRLDKQAKTSDSATNLQVQLNDLNRRTTALCASGQGTTVAQILISKKVFTRANQFGPNSGVRANLVNAAVTALNISFRGGVTCVVVELNDPDSLKEYRRLIGDR